MQKIYLILITCLLLACDSEVEPKSTCYTETDPPRNSHKVTIKQGVWGDVWFWSGNFMPVGRGEICQVERQIYVYELTTYDDVERIDYTPFYTAINSQLVAVVESDLEGFFQLDIEPGSYSLFVKEEDNFYSNLANASVIFPVEVKSNEVSEVRFDITYKASF